MKTNRQFLALSLTVTFALLSLSSCKGGRTVEAAREGRSAAVSAADQDFMNKAAEANLTEIDIARVALQKSDNSDVRDYANMIQSDHTAALEDVTDLMKEKGLPAPKTLAADTRRDVDRMSGLSGAEFDREFVNMMVADHQKTLELFRDALANAQDPSVKKYAEDLTPKLEMHLDKAQRLQSKLFGGST
jgi:putative membrane protein